MTVGVLCLRGGILVLDILSLRVSRWNQEPWVSDRLTGYQ